MVIPIYLLRFHSVYIPWCYVLDETYFVSRFLDLFQLQPLKVSLEN